MSTPIKFNKKADFIAALEAERARVTAADKIVAAEHKAEERQYHKDFQAKARQLAKMPYADLKALDRYADKGVHWSPPSCPVSQEARLDRIVRSINAGTQERFTLTARGAWSDAFDFLTHVDDDGTVC